MNVLRPVAFRPHLTMGLALNGFRNDGIRLPAGTGPGEANLEQFEVSLHPVSSIEEEYTGMKQIVYNH